MNKQEIYQYLKENNIWYEAEEHEAVFNMEELAALEIRYPGYDAKNLFVRDDKKKNFYLITVKGDKRVDLKKFRRDHNTRALSFASSEDLMNIMSLIPGAVSPLGILNDSECRVLFFLDSDFMKDERLIGIHPNDNTATIWMKVNDLLDVIKKHGTGVRVVEI